MKQNGRKITLALTIVAVFLLLGAGIFLRQTIWLEWCRSKAAGECLMVTFDGQRPPWAFRSLLHAGEAGYPQIARLLKDERYEVWTRTSDVIDAACPPDAILEFYLREDRLALLRYLFNVSQNDRTLWREDTSTRWWPLDRGYTDATWYEYWSRRKGETLEPFHEGIQFCESVLLGKIRFPLGMDPSSYVHFKIRALHALGAMLQPGEAERPGSRMGERIISILRKAAREDSDPDARFDAVFRLLLRSEECKTPESATDFRIISLAEWLEFPRKKPEGYQHRWNLLALCHLDHPIGLRIIARLLKDPTLATTLKEILSSRSQVGSLVMPQWTPLGTAARRFLKGSSLECFHAAVLIAEGNLPEEVVSISDALQVHDSKEVQLALNACLLALGDERRREAVRSEVERLRASLPPLSWFRVQDLAEVLLLSGDMEFLAKESAEQLDFPIEEMIEGLPEEFKANPIPGSWTEEEAAWWVRNKSRISWDAEKRRFIVR